MADDGGEASPDRRADAGSRDERGTGGPEHRVNTNQVFQWRRQYRAGNLSVPEENAAKLLPMVISDEITHSPGEEQEQSAGDAIHIEFPGRVPVTIEAGVDPALAGAVIERLAR